MKYSTTKYLGIILLVIVSIFAFYRIYDFANYLIFKHKTKIESKEMNNKFLSNQLRLSYLDSIQIEIENNESDNALKFINYLINNDSNDVSSIIKRGFIYYKLKEFAQSEKDFEKVISSTSSQIGDNIILNENKEQYYYAMIGLMLVKDTIINGLVREYNMNRKKSYLQLSIDEKNGKLNICADSVIMKKFYNTDYE